MIKDPYSEEGDGALKRVINVPNRYIGRKFVKELEEFSDRHGVYLYEGLKSMPIKIPYLIKSIVGFRRLLEPLKKNADELDPSELIYLLREALDYDKFIMDGEIPALIILKLPI